jgi:hypothetical protein
MRGQVGVDGRCESLVRAVRALIVAAVTGGFLIRRATSFRERGPTAESGYMSIKATALRAAAPAALAPGVRPWAGLGAARRAGWHKGFSLYHHGMTTERAR